MVVEISCGVQSRVASVSSGDDMPTKARNLGNPSDAHNACHEG